MISINDFVFTLGDAVTFLCIWFIVATFLALVPFIIKIAWGSFLFLSFLVSGVMVIATALLGLGFLTISYGFKNLFEFICDKTTGE